MTLNPHSTSPRFHRRSPAVTVGLGLALTASLVGSAAHSAEPAVMSGEWGPAACAAWNADPVLTKDLVDSGWIKNDKGRGYKVLQVYRSDCDDKPTMELRVALQDAHRFVGEQQSLGDR